MALFKFTKAILNGEKVQVFNFGKHKRDFTFIDDIVEGVARVLDTPASPNLDWNKLEPAPGSSLAPWRLYNIGNNKPVDLMQFISALESRLGRKATIEMLPLQPGDVPDTFANVDELVNNFNYKPSTSVKDGVKKFVHWYKEYFQIS